VLNKYGRKADSPPEFQGDHLWLFVSDDLKKWEYLHEFYQADRKWTDKSEDNMCPSFLPLPSGPEGGNPSGKHLLLFISHNKGCQYYIGNYKDDKFFPDVHGRMTWQDNAYFAPEALIDKSGRQIMWSWIFDDRPDSIKNFTGWTGTFGLPRSLWLDKDGTLKMQPVKELQNLRQNERSRNNLKIQSGLEMDISDFGKELLELEITFQSSKASQVGVMVDCSTDGREQTLIYYDASEKKLKVDATHSSIDLGRKNIESAPFEWKKGEPLVLRIFIDKSIIEVFANDRQAIARSVYPRLGGTGVKLFAKGGDVKVLSAKAWEIMPSNTY
jgi:beta-fructofuranosidase